MNKIEELRHRIFSFLLMIAIFLLGILVGVYDVPRWRENVLETKFKKLIRFIENEYVDPIEADSLLDYAITQVMDRLDPHSVYIPKSEMQYIEENMQGAFEGVGVEFTLRRDSVVVVRVLEDGPSEHAGLLPGDCIIEANGIKMVGKEITNAKIIETLKGAKGSEVSIDVYRKQEKRFINFKVRRNRVSLPSIVAAYFITDDMGYVKIDRFTINTFVEFRNSVNQLIDDGAETIVLDLRGNPGGILSVATQIADEILEDDKLIVYTKNRKGESDRFYAYKEGSLEKKNIYILIDESSASASEVLAGAIQDHDRGTIVGRRSFGKGLVQKEIRLDDGSAVRLTVSKYYTPSGRSIQKPYTKGDHEGYHEDIANRISNGELTNKDSIPISDLDTFKTAKGRIVHAGGGIIPDVFVPIDTVHLSNWFHTTLLPQTISQITLDYIDLHIKEIQSFVSLESFILDFDETELYRYFLEQIDIDESTFSNPKKKSKIIKKQLKAMVARYYWGNQGFYQIWNQDDSMLEKIIEIESSKKLSSTG